MTPQEKKLTTGLLAAKKGIEMMSQNITQYSQKLAEEKEMLRKLVEDYNKARVELFKQKLQILEMTLCTFCDEWFTNSNDEELFLVETRKRLPWSPEKASSMSQYGYRSSSKVHRVCPECREKIQAKHGWKGQYDIQSGDQESFSVFSVERGIGGYYAKKVDRWEYVDEHKCLFNKPSNEVIDKFTKVLGLPPKIELRAQLTPSDEVEYELVIHENTLNKVG